MAVRADEHIRAKCFHPTGTFVEFPKEEVETSIPERFERIVRMYPHRIAVKTQKHLLTYNELNQSANRVAHAVLDRQGKKHHPVGILIEHGAPAIIAMLGVLKAGKMFFVMDASFPEERIAYMLEDSQADLMVTNGKNVCLAKPYLGKGIGLLNIDERAEGIDSRNSGHSLSSDSISHLVYTSGSTGQPKGVLNTHRNALHNALRSTNSVHVSPHDRLTLLRSFSTSGAINDMFDGLLNGAAIYPFDLKEEGLNTLARWLNDEKITIFNSVSSTFRFFLRTLTNETFPSVRLIYLGGETVYRNDVQGYKAHFADDCIWVVRLGSSEAGFVCNHFIDKKSQIHSNVVPIGYPYQDVEILLWNSSGNPAKEGSSGEIGVKSRYLSPGYWRSPLMTEKHFIPDAGGNGERIYLTGDLGQLLPDGKLVHLGCKDLTVKIRGFRVDTSEVEATLLNHAEIAEVLVTAREDQPANMRLVAYIVSKEQTAISIDGLKTFLKDKLPDYMVPTAFVLLKEMPLMPTGKIDRKSLPAPSRVRPNIDTPFAMPRNTTESEIATIWAEVLCLEEVGVHDNFFDLGGDSLAASRVISRILKHFQLEIPIQSLFESPTVAMMAAGVNELRAKS